MVLHIGVDPQNGKIDLFDTISKSSSKIDIEKVTSNDIGHVANLFLSVKQYSSENIGNVCACLDEKYGNDIRFEFVKQARKYGFHHFEIIDVNTALYLHVASHKPKNFETLWILWAKRCFMFVQKAANTLFIKSYPVLTRADIDFIKSQKPPEVLFMQNDQPPEVAKELCPHVKFYYYSPFKMSASALSKAKATSTENRLSNVITTFGRKCEILLGTKSILTIFPDEHLPYEKLIDVKEGEKSGYIKVIENDINFTTFTFKKQALLFYINTNGIYYISEINDLEIFNSQNLEIFNDEPKIASQCTTPDKKERPLVPTTAKPGFDAMISRLYNSHDFKNYFVIMRKLGLIQAQLNIIQPLINLNDFIFLAEKGSNYSEIESIIKYLENLFNEQKTEFQFFAQGKGKYCEKVEELNNLIGSDLINVRQNFDENLILWKSWKQIPQKCVSEIAWIHLTQIRLSTKKIISFQTYPEVVKFFMKINSEIQNHKEKIEELFELTKKMGFIHQAKQFCIFIQEFKNQWNVFLKNYKNLVAALEIVYNTNQFLKNAKVIFRNRQSLLKNRMSNSMKADKDILYQENYVKELIEFLNEVWEIEKELKELQRQIEFKNLQSFDFPNIIAVYKKAENGISNINWALTNEVKKENELLESLHEFNNSFKAIKSELTDLYKRYMNKDGLILDKNLLNKNTLIEVKQDEISNLKNKAEEFATKNFSMVTNQITEVNELWDKLLPLLPQTNEEQEIIKKFIEERNNILSEIKTFTEMLKTINDSEKLSDFLKKFQELDKKIFDFEKLTYDLDSRFPMFRNYTDENIANVYKIYETLKTEILNVAAVILQKNDETLNVNNLTKLYQFFNMVSSADDQQTSKTQKLKMSSKLDKSFQTFWRNRQSRLQSFKVNNKNGMYDDNWLKRMSKMPKFDIPEKFNSFNTGINAIGIDLGTSSCCVAVNRENRIEAVAIDITGERTLPSFVGYDEKDVKCGKVVVGNLGMYSKSTIFDTKRVIGKTYAEVEIDPMWLFNVVEDGESVKLEVQGYMNTILRQTPEEVTSELLNYMKQKAEEFQKKAVDNVVITIPASFTDNQKEATLKAAELAGLIHVHLLPEPVAASITYFIDRRLPNDETILLFDLGGGTLDICIFEVNNFNFKIIRNTGDANIGGRNFDKLLYEYFKEELLSRHGINVELKDTRKYKLMLKCQEIKHNLSALNDQRICVDDYGPSIDAPPIEITRQNFENMSVDFVNDIKILVKYATDNLPNPIAKVLHVGGSSRMPLIKSMLIQMFPNAEQCCEVHPEEVVAVGAAYYSYHLAQQQK